MQIEKYKGEWINYSEATNVFFVGELTAPSLKELKKKINARLKKTFTRFEAYYCPYTDIVTEVIVTSMDVAGSYAWVTSTNGRRSVGIKDLYVKDEKSKSVYGEMEILNAVIEDCRKELRGLKKKLKRVKIE